LFLSKNREWQNFISGKKVSQKNPEWDEFKKTGHGKKAYSVGDAASNIKKPESRNNWKKGVKKGEEGKGSAMGDGGQGRTGKKHQKMNDYQGDWGVVGGKKKGERGLARDNQGASIDAPT